MVEAFITSIKGVVDIFAGMKMNNQEDMAVHPAVYPGYHNQLQS